MNSYKLNGLAGHLTRTAITKEFKINHQDIYKTVKSIDGNVITHKDGREFMLKLIPIRELKFEGIDDWNRAIFKDKYNARYGNVDILFNWEDTFETVTEKISEVHMQYFGRTFGCEPMGSSINTDFVKLVKKFSYDGN